MKRNNTKMEIKKSSNAQSQNRFLIKAQEKCSPLETTSQKGECIVEEREEKVRNKAYELYEKRSCQSGHELEDWLEAEKTV